MPKRHEIIGIKQAIHFEWLQKTTNLLLAGLDARTIRQELDSFLAEEKGDGFGGAGSKENRSFTVTNLMKVWVSPDPDLLKFRNASLALLQNSPSLSLGIHWGMVSATYPFWFNVARQTGRLLALQNQVTQLQITNRLKEQYGDRQTISRYTRYVLRSFIDWGVIKDSQTKGCYEKANPKNIVDSNLAILMFEATLHATPDGKIAMGLLVNNPALFPFYLPLVSGDFISQHNKRIDVLRFGLDDELLKLK